jgi:hypothetical protein
MAAVHDTLLAIANLLAVLAHGKVRECHKNAVNTW